MNEDGEFWAWYWNVKDEFIVTTTHNELDSADPSSMQDAFHIWTQLNDLTLHEFL